MKKRILSILLILSACVLSKQAVAQSYNGFGQSNLPLVVINTGGQSIPDEPKLVAHMGIVWNGAGTMNSSSDPFNDYNGKIGIETRGSSSQGFPKKSYGLELRTEADEDSSASLLGMPKEEDWILYAPYSDKTLIRNVLVFTLGASLGRYETRCRFVELFLNNSYQGVYVLMEKLKRDKNRIDISKLKEDDIAGEDLTGGYIIKIDKSTGNSGFGWYSDYTNDASKHSYYQYEYPKYDEIQPEQKAYIHGYVDDFERAVHNRNLDGENGFRTLADEESFVDFMIMNELARNIDGYRLSTFLHKDKNEKLKIGPLWDFNLSLGNADYYQGESTSGFQFQTNLGGDDFQIPFWWDILFNDNTYRKKLKNRWSELRQNQLSDATIDLVMDSLTNLLADAQQRNFQRWDILGQYVWPNAYVGYSYHSETTWMHSWITNRLSWLDNTINGLYTGNDELANNSGVSVFPNPFSNRLTVQFNESINDKLKVEVYSSSGVKVFEKDDAFFGNQLTISDGKLATLARGVYVLKIYCKSEIIATEKLVKN